MVRVAVPKPNSQQQQPRPPKPDPNKTGRPPRPRQDQRRKKLDKAENEEGIYRASGSANIILYVGLGMISIGLIITFVGLGDKGFRTLELKLIGPSLVGCGAFFAILRVLFCTVPSCCRACCKCCRKKPDDTEELIYGTDDPLSRTGYVAGNNTNMSANSSDSRKIGATNEVQKFARKRSGIVKTDRLEGANFEEDFQNKMLSLETDVKEDCKNVKDKSPGFVSGSATKPVSYDTYSTDTSSQFSVDIVDVAPTNREFGEVGQFMKNPSALYQQDDEIDGIVLNAMKLQVESEK